VKRYFWTITAVLSLFAHQMPAMASEVVLAEFSSDMVPSPVKYALLAPTGFRTMKDLPLIINLHGGRGSRDSLIRQRALWDRLWKNKTIPPVMVVMPSVTRQSFYINFKDGSERWGDFIAGPFLEYLRTTYPVSRDSKHTFLMGVSMGGMGSLRIAFYHPDRFGAVAALEPGIEPILKWSDMKPKYRFWRADALFERAYGRPVDPKYWARNNPANIVVESADKIRDSGLQIYLEAGDEDQFWLYEGAEFLHRILWDMKVKHEYHLVRGADHLGPSLRPRTVEAIKFLIRSYRPWGAPSPRVQNVITSVERLRDKTTDEKDHYNQPD